ncbi:unnamed protein product [Urochloa humidicola]
MDDRGKSFLNVMIGDYVAVPKMFTNIIRGQIPELVKLEAADGKTYDVRLAREHHELVFRSGWAKFSSAYELEHCDILVFKYSGNSRFKVRFFNSSGCEKELSSVLMNTSLQGRCGHRMKSGSDNTVCKECAAHQYWHQMDKRRFFVVMLDASGLRNGLTVPKKFANNVGGQIPETIKLEVPDGETYDIKVAKDKEHQLVLRSGWVEFAIAYELQQGDILMLGYNGHSRFKVRVFSPSGCEKELTCFPINRTPCVQERSISHNKHLQSPGCQRSCYGMSKSGPICKDCISNHYWHHMNDQDKCFFQVMMNANDFKNKLRLPDKFVTNIRGRISEEVKLEVRDGKTYTIKVAEEQNELVLRSGWQQFARAYDLEQGDFLVFTYSGHSHYKVRIFDLSSCEKELSCVVMDNSPYVQERSSSHHNYMESPMSGSLAKHCGDSSIYSRTPKMNPTESPSHESAESDATSSDDIEEPMSSGERWTPTQSHYVSATGCSLTTTHKASVFMLEQKLRAAETDATSSKGIQEPMSSGEHWTPTQYRYVLARGCNLTTAQKARVFMLEQKLRPHIPLYVTNMNKTSLSDRSLVIDKDYAVKHLPHEDQTITLCHPSNIKKWHAGFKFKPDGTCILSVGSSDFFHDNGLQEGDISVFEVLKSETRTTMTVHLLKRYCPPGVITSSESSVYEDTEARYAVSQRTRLDNQQKRKIIKKVKDIQSETLIFVFVKGRSGDYKMGLKKDWAVKYLPHEEQPLALRRRKKGAAHTEEWEAKLLISSDGLYQLGGHWNKFVRDNMLRQGDICLFELLKEKSLTMYVHIIRDPAKKMKRS